MLFPGNYRNLVYGLVFSLNGRYLAATLGGSNGVRVFDRDKNWSEVFRDTEYGSSTFGVAFARNGWLATASFDGKVRLYDRNFRPIVPPISAPRGRLPLAVAFSPDQRVLAVGYNDAAAVDLFDGRDLSRMPGPDLAGLERGGLYQVAWSLDGQVLYASGRYPGYGLGYSPILVLSWERGGHGKRL